MYKKINTKAAKQILTNPNSILVDIRDRESFEEGHVENAIHLTEKNVADFIEKTDKNSPILVICYHGNSSQVVADYLCQQGFVDVYSINGGYEEWIIN